MSAQAEENPADRDYAGEMRALIDAETAGGRYTPALTAAHIVGKLRETDPDLLAGWLDLGAVQFVRAAITLRDRSTRGHARRTAAARAFGGATEASAAGDVVPLTRYLDCPYQVSEDGARKPLRAMVKQELVFVAGTYRDTAKAATFEAAFFRALARRVGTGTVADHFTEDQLVCMRQGLAA